MISSRSSTYLEVIESLSKKNYISEGDVLGLTKEIVIQSALILNINRVNAWILENNDNKDECLKNIVAYDRNINQFYFEDNLLKKEYPIYFTHINQNNVIISVNAQNEFFNQEIRDSYLIPNNIKSMMEVPIQTSGKLKGIICFENQHEIREWTTDEQNFVMAMTQLLVLALEINKKNKYKLELEKTIQEKSILIQEINHRVKNNLAIITALIRSEMHNAKDDFHKEQINGLLNKTYSLTFIQDLMYQNQNYETIILNDFIPNLIANIKQSFIQQIPVYVNYQFDETYEYDAKKATSLCLIINEIITNCLKYACSIDKENTIEVSVRKIDNELHFITISDNGPGLPSDYKTKGTGVELMDALVDQIDGKITFESSSKGTKVEILC